MSLYKQFLKKVAHAQVKHPVATILVVFAITLIFMGGASQVKTVAALENMMPPSLEEIGAFNTLRDVGLGQDMVAIVIERNPESTITKNSVLDWETYQYVKLVTATIQNETDILQTYSLSTTLEMLNNGEALTEEVFNAFLEDENAMVYINNYVNHARTNTIIIATTDVSANDARMKQLAKRINADMDSLGHPPGLRYVLTGTPIVQQELGKLISHDRKVTQNISTLFVFLIVMVLFGTFTSAIVPILIVTISVTWLYGTMGYTGLPISTLAGGVAAMVIGIGIDYAIHLMNKYKFERKRGLDVKESIEAAVTDTGVALTGAAVATMLAFIAFLTGAMPEMRRFGILMTLGVGYSFLLSIGALPALLILEERLFFILRKHLHFGVEGEYFLATKEETCPPEFQAVNEEEGRNAYAHLRQRFRIYKKQSGPKKKQRRPR
ncbi:MMPL family transporter [Candidatus Woesearchaeota archaeon]|nr:MMPL family transporter [Candidatus Woesearchaeota archaeon]